MFNHFYMTGGIRNFSLSLAFLPVPTSRGILQGASMGGDCPMSRSSPSERLTLGLRVEVALLHSLFSQVVNALFHKQPCRFADLFMYYADRSHIH